MADPNGQITYKKLLFAGQKDTGDDGNGILDFLLAPLPGDGIQKLYVLSGITVFLFLLLMVVVVVLRRQREEEVEVSNQRI